MKDDEPRIIIDSDWKKEAQQEKERLVEAQSDIGDGQALPEASFLELVNMISMQAAISLGGLKTPDGRVIPPDLDLARHHIDLLEILLEKTKNNLDAQESAVLSATLHELRLAFVQMASGRPAPETPRAPGAR